MSGEERQGFDDEIEPPPFFTSWRVWYGAIIAELVILVGLFALITGALS